MWIQKIVIFTFVFLVTTAPPSHSCPSGSYFHAGEDLYNCIGSDNCLVSNSYMKTGCSCSIKCGDSEVDADTNNPYITCSSGSYDVADADICPWGYVCHVNGKCYKAFTDQRTWSSANSECESEYF